MKKILALFLLLIVPISVNAQSACNYEEQANLTDGINLIKINYNEMEEVAADGNYLPPEGVANDPDLFEDYEYLITYFEIEITNMTEDYYIIVRNDVNDETFRINYSDTNNGAYSFEERDISKVHRYTFEIYSSDLTPCKDEVFGVEYETTPRYNYNSEYSVCETYPDEAICEKYTTLPEMSEEDFFERIEVLNEETGNDDAEKEPEETSFVSEYLVYIILGIVIIAVGVAGTIVMLRRRRKL